MRKTSDLSEGIGLPALAFMVHRGLLLPSPRRFLSQTESNPSNCNEEESSGFDSLT